MKWTRTHALALADPRCAVCRGLGLRLGREECPCNCVFRAVFRACYARWRHCSERDRCYSRISWTGNGNNSRGHWGRKNEEYIADFQLIARRSLRGRQSKLFRLHFELGQEWQQCCGKLGLDRGSFFHEAYRVQQRLGRIYAELRPYALYPLDEYFGGSVRTVQIADPIKPEVIVMRPRRLVSVISRRFPLVARADAAA